MVSLVGGRFYVDGVRQQRRRQVSSFGGLGVDASVIRGGDEALLLYEATVLVGRAAEFPRNLRNALRARGFGSDNQIQLVVSTPHGGLLRRRVVPAMEAEARAFAARVNAVAAELRKQ